MRLGTEETMKLYVTRWHCPGCDRQIEYRMAPYITFDKDLAPLCTECATTLRKDTSSVWLPEVVVTFE